MKTDEIWKDVVGYEGLYMVSNLGNIRSESKAGSIERKIMKTRENEKGYIIITICKNSKPAVKMVHKIIAEAFIPNPKNKPFIHHKNHVKNDNRIENLMWVTHKENMNFFYSDIERSEKKYKKHRGSKNGNSKLTEKQVTSIREIHKNNSISIKEIANRFNISYTNTLDIINNKIWKHI